MSQLPPQDSPLQYPNQLLVPEELVSIFYNPPELFGGFERISSDNLPVLFRRLLDHKHHMTVTLETFYKSPVDVHVIDCKEAADVYVRKILLSTQADKRIVLFGIVRLFPQHLDAEVFESIRQQRVPLGRILIGKKVLRSVILENLYRVSLEGASQDLLAMKGQNRTYGRTARIEVGGEPAIDLLEIVTPPDSWRHEP